MRARRLLLLPLAFLLGAPAPTKLERSQAEYAAAKAQAEKLQAIADRATESLERLRSRQRAAAAAIDSAEARITLADLRLATAEADARAQRLAIATAQRPVASLLAGVAVMGQRPPLLALMDEGSIDSLVQTRILLDSTLAVIRTRTRAHAARLARADRAVEAAQIARNELAASRRALVERRAEFASIEQSLLKLAARTGSAAVQASDRMLATGDASERVRREYQDSSAIRALARAFAAQPAIPPRPGSSDGPLFRSPFVYRLPASAPLTQGLGDVDRSGIRARGVTLATARGAPLEAPGAGTVRFAGPFRGFDGVLIIDHGGGWVTMLVNLSPGVGRGDRVAPGDPVGRALGPISVELYRNGKAYSPALIAGSSPPLSNDRKGG